MAGRLEADIFPVVGKMDISTITPRLMLEAVRKIEARGAIQMAHRVKNHCSEIFRYAIPDGRCESNPCRDLTPAMMKAGPVKRHPKVAAKDLPTLFTKLNADGAERMSHLALRWNILTMVCTQETRFAEWDEFENLDGPEPLWRISAIAVTHALFDVGDSKLAVVSELFGEDRFFADSDAFWSAQLAAIEARKVAYLEWGWSDVEIMSRGERFRSWDHVHAQPGRAEQRCVERRQSFRNRHRVAL